MNWPTPGDLRGLVLGVESSCDETAAAVVRDGRIVLSNVIATQHDLHAEYRGVVPEIASRAHAERIGAVIDMALNTAHVRAEDLRAVAVSAHPGLIGSLLVGVSAAKAVAWTLGLPVIGVDHVRAHLYAGFLERPAGPAAPIPLDNRLFPALGLVVSGGHSSIYRLNSPLSIELLGSTRDDAVGEAYDKAAAVLGLPYPGGPEIDRFAALGDERRFDLPIARLEHGSLDFSFSGLKTALLYTVHGVPSERGRGGTPALTLDQQTLHDLCAGFQRAAVEAIMLRLDRALAQHPDCRTLLIGGGVSANSRLRSRCQEFAMAKALRPALPELQFCLDNAAMIAGLGSWVLAERRWQGDDLQRSASAQSPD